jgi:spore maturation protein CgeB
MGMGERLRLVFLGLSITSSWGNGHATNYRALLRELRRRGHDVLFLEREAPWYADNADMPRPPFCRTSLYGSFEELAREHESDVAAADAVVVGSFVPQGAEVGAWVQETATGVKAFYDIDTPVTLAKVEKGECEYLEPELIPGYDLYLSFTGGPTLTRLEEELGSPRARAFYCLVDPELYHPTRLRWLRWDLGYIGTYSADRQPTLEGLLVDPARLAPDLRFVVAGPQYPPLDWPRNVRRIEHLPPSRHRRFYNSQRFTLNVTRADMIRAGYSPSVRLFEAAACGAPIISDRWPGIEEFFTPGEEILLADTADDVLRIMRSMPERERRAIAQRARERVLREHTASHRAEQLERMIAQAREGAAPVRAGKVGVRR